MSTRDEVPDQTSPQMISDLLSLVSEPVIPPEVIALWTVDEREKAVQWAGRKHLHASDNPVRRTREPGFVTRAREICGSMAQAQVAVEAFAGRNSSNDFTVSGTYMAALARDALTGLVVLLGERAPS